MFAAGSAMSWYAVSVGVLAAGITALYLLVLASVGEPPVRPLWPWER